MVEKNLQEPENPENNEKADVKAEKGEKAKGGLKKYILFGAIGLVVVLGGVVGTVLLMGGNDSVEPTVSEEKTAVEQAEIPTEETADLSSEQEESLNDDSLLAQLETGDSDAMDKIMDNLEFLDYEPEISDMSENETNMSVEDSTTAVNWLEQEKKRLSDKEKELEAREKELNILDKKVTQKILKIEQAESTRISNLARLYDGMDSRAVSRLLANLDDATVVAILPRMKQKNASAVLQLMPAQRAASLSKQMITIAEN